MKHDAAQKLLAHFRRQFTKCRFEAEKLPERGRAAAQPVEEVDAELLLADLLIAIGRGEQAEGALQKLASRVDVKVFAVPLLPLPVASVICGAAPPVLWLRCQTPRKFEFQVEATC